MFLIAVWMIGVVYLAMFESESWQVIVAWPIAAIAYVLKRPSHD